MRSLLGALALAAALAGCAEVKDIVSPVPAAPPTRTTAVAPPPAPSEAPLLAPPEAAPTPPPPAPIPPSPPPPPPPPKPSVAVPPPPPPPKPRVLSPQLDDEQRIEREAQGRIDGTERLIEKIDQRKLAADQHENLSTIQSFVVKAKEALSVRDVQRAFTLADKAFRLAEDLSRAIR